MATVLPKKVLLYQNEFTEKSWKHTMENNGPRMSMSPEDILISIESKAEERYERSDTTKDRVTFIRDFRNNVLNRMCN